METRRLNYKEKIIKNITETDLMIATSGIVISKVDSNFVLDDGSGKVSVFLEDNEVNNGDYVRVFGRIMSFSEGVEIQGEFTQNLNTINKQLHKKIVNFLE